MQEGVETEIDNGEDREDGAQHQIQAEEFFDDAGSHDDGSFVINFQMTQQGKLRDENSNGMEVFTMSAEMEKLARLGKFSSTDILIDTGSSCSVFNNEDMLIHKEK